MTSARAEIFAICIVAAFVYAVFRCLDFLGVHYLDPAGLWPF